MFKGIKGIHHIAFVVEDFDKSIEIFKDELGLNYQGEASLDYRGVRVGVFEAGDLLLEIIHPYKKGPVKDYMDKNGPGFFHMAFDVENIEYAICSMIDNKGSIKMKDRVPREGLNWQVASFKKCDTLDIIMQFAEGPKEIE